MYLMSVSSSSPYGLGLVVCVFSGFLMQRGGVSEVLSYQLTRTCIEYRRCTASFIIRNSNRMLHVLRDKTDKLRAALP